MMSHSHHARHASPYRASSAGRSSAGRSTLLPHPSPLQGGFTLVEMLVAVALVLLMMTLFAQVFQGATKSMSQQKGMAENDQKARRLITLLKGDLTTRTFVDVKPFKPSATTAVFPNRRGYFAISENDPDNHTDDVLSLTVELTEGLYLTGRTTLLRNPNDTINTGPPQTINLGATMANDSISLTDYLTAANGTSVPTILRNQPEFDDGLPTPNQTGISRRAEVCWFLRNGNLYRRVLLVREAYDDDGGDASLPLNSTMFPGNYHSGMTVNGSGVAWRDFDYAMIHRGYTMATMTNHGVRFLTSASLANDNSSLPVDPIIGYPLSMGIPHLRFGSTPVRSDGSVNGNGYPREHLDATDNASLDTTFIGRPTLQECAHSGFTYPGNYATNPFDTATALTLDASTGLISQYSPGTDRRGEEIVMNNVHSFDIQVYDDASAVQGFVQLGNSSAAGYYAASQRLNNPNMDRRDNRYDTWHPSPLLPQPPYRPVSVGADGVNGSPGDDAVDDTVGMADAMDPAELGTIGSDDEIALKAIMITIRYFDVSSNQMRQLTLVQSLVN